MTDFQLQRLNMVESQVRPSDVTDQRILRAMLDIPREKFVPPALASMAYMDDPVPVATNAAREDARCLLAPRTFAKLVHLADIGPDAVVLDVACATGYSTAVLARLARRVAAVDCDEDLIGQARRMLADLGATNATIHAGALAAGHPAEAPYDAIVVEGALQSVPRPLLEQLADGGRLVAMVAGERIEGAAMCRAQVWRRSRDSYDSRTAFEAGAVLLPGFAVPAGFVF